LIIRRQNPGSFGFLGGMSSFCPCFSGRVCSQICVILSLTGLYFKVGFSFLVRSGR
jgi:hypothetical protein